MSTLTHHGIIYVPFGYSKAFKQLTDLSEVHGGKPLIRVIIHSTKHILTTSITGSSWGAGTFAGVDGARQPSAREVEIANIQGKSFYEIVSRVQF